MANDEIRVRLTGDDTDLRAALGRLRTEVVKFEGALKDVSEKGGSPSAGIDRGLDKTTGRLSKFKSELRSQLGDVNTVAAGMLVGGGLQAGFQAVAQYIGESIDAAANLEQAIGGTAAVFGDSSAAVDRWAKGSAQSVGLSETAFREATTGIGAALKRMTGDVDFASEGSIKLTEIGADLAATFGGTTADAVHALGRAFVGEADPAERFGLGLQITKVQAYAAEQGISNLTTGSDEYARILLEMIEEQAKANGALGQFGRESDTAAGKAQRLRAELENLQATSGDAFLPLQTAGLEAKIVLGSLASLITGDFQSAIDAMNALIYDAGGIIDGTSDKVGKMGGSVERTGTKLEGAKDEVVKLTGGLDEMKEAIDAVVGPQLDLSGAVIDFEAAVDDARKAIRDNGKTLDVHTEKGRANRAELDNIAESTWLLIQAQKENNAKTKTLSESMDRGRQEFIDAARAAGLTRKEARDLADQYGLTEDASEGLRRKTDDTKRGLQKAETQLKNTSGAAKTLDERYGQIPDNVTTNIRAPGLKQTNQDVAKLDNALAGLPNVARIEFKTTGLGDGLGLLGLGSFGGGLMGISPLSAVGMAYSSMGRPGDVISGYRPGARTLSGALSYHAQGRALDITPEMGIALAIRQRFKGRTRELISPWPWLNVHNGSDYRYSDAVQAQHDGRTNVRHIHWAMAEGGFGTVSKPTVFLAGERGREDFAFVPHSKGGMRGGGDIHIHINAGMLVHQSNLERDLATVLRRFLRTNGGVGALARGM